MSKAPKHNQAEAKPRAKPVSLTPEIAAELCERVGNGEALIRVCEDAHMPTDRAVRKWEKENEQFGSDFALARARRLEVVETELLEISDDGRRDYEVGEDGKAVVNSDHIQRAKLRVDTRLKLLACWDPKRYGTQRTEVDMTAHLPDVAKATTQLDEILGLLASK